jgi:biopolymer transport protein ExbB
MTMDRSSIERRLWLVLAIAVWVTFASQVLAPAVSAQESSSVGEVQPEHQKSRFIWFIESSGVIGAVILLLSIYFIATVGKLFVELRHQVSMPPQVVAQCDDMLQKKDFVGIYNLLKSDQSHFSRLLYTGVSELPNGLFEAREAMGSVNEAVTVGMEKKISMLAVLGTLGPMIGLLGTLKGMIASFSVIALSGTQLKSDQVAKGISEALLLTFEGVALSVPAIYFFSLFKNRVSTISVDTMLKADEFLRHFAHAARKKSPAAAGAPATA